MNYMPPGYIDESRPTRPYNKYILTFQRNEGEPLEQMEYKGYSDSEGNAEEKEAIEKNVQSFIKGYTRNPNARVVSYTKLNGKKDLESSD